MSRCWIYSVTCHGSEKVILRLGLALQKSAGGSGLFQLCCFSEKLACFLCSPRGQAGCGTISCIAWGGHIIASASWQHPGSGTPRPPTRVPVTGESCVPVMGFLQTPVPSHQHQGLLGALLPSGPCLQRPSLALPVFAAGWVSWLWAERVSPPVGGRRW